jgi:hypothetical protein
MKSCSGRQGDDAGFTSAAAGALARDAMSRKRCFRAIPCRDLEAFQSWSNTPGSAIVVPALEVEQGSMIPVPVVISVGVPTI